MTSIFERVRDQVLDKNRWRYLTSSFSGCLSNSRSACPNCQGDPAETLGRKLLVTKLRRCAKCKLLYRTPTDPPAFNQEFYQDDYDQGFTTDCPDDEALSKMLNAKFKNTPKDFSDKIELFNLLLGDSKVKSENKRILDFGASWGYGTWQFQEAGFDVLGFEPGKPRARYAREKLNVDVVDEQKLVEDAASVEKFDLVFSSHVLEHVPTPTDTIDLMATLLKPGGVIVAFTPNGSREYFESAPEKYHNHWGMVHPNYLDAEYYLSTLPNWPKFISGTPIGHNKLKNWDQIETQTVALESWELLLIAKRPSIE